MKVKVYYNTNLECLSIMHATRVIAYAEAIILRNVQFKVSTAGRNKCLKEGVKNVHAKVEGELLSVYNNDNFSLRNNGKDRQIKMDLMSYLNRKITVGIGTTEVSYNPFKEGYFYRCKDSSEIRSALGCTIINKVILAKEC